jgi:hypothetical protein
MKNIIIALSSLAVCASSALAYAAPCGSDKSTLSVKDVTAATYPLRTQVDLTDVPERMVLQEEVVNADAKLACRMPGFAAFKAKYPELQAGSKSIDAQTQAGCVTFKSANHTLKLLFAAECPAAAAPVAAGGAAQPLAGGDRPDIEIKADGKASDATLPVTGTSIKIKNSSSAKYTVKCGEAGNLQTLEIDTLKVGTLELSAELVKKGGILECNAGLPAAFELKVAPAPAESAKKLEVCTANAFDPTDADAAKLEDFRCGGVKDGAVQLCLGAGGDTIGPVPELHEGKPIDVLVLVRSDFEATLSLETSFKQTLLVNPVEVNPFDKKSSGWSIKQRARVHPKGLGDLEIKIVRGAGTVRPPIKPGSTTGMPDECQFADKTSTRSFHVSGHYHFSGGIMVAYTRMQERSYSRQTGDDGVMRLGEQASPGVDYVANVVAYPWGVDADHDIASLGLLFGTSLNSIGKRWYAGVELASPIGFGVSAGTAIVVVPKLDEPLMAGQPFAGDTIATHSVAEPTWYVGINLQPQLFQKAFGALFGSSEKKEDAK